MNRAACLRADCVQSACSLRTAEFQAVQAAWYTISRRETPRGSQRQCSIAMGCSFCANRIRKRSNVEVGNRVIPLRSTRFYSYMHFLLHPSFYRFFPLFSCFFFPLSFSLFDFIADYIVIDSLVRETNMREERERGIRTRTNKRASVPSGRSIGIHPPRSLNPFTFRYANIYPLVFRLCFPPMKETRRSE